MLDELDAIEREGLDSLGRTSDAASLEQWRIAHLGTKGVLKQATARFRDVPRDQKPAVGARLNAVQKALQEAYEARKSALNGAGGSGGVGSATTDGSAGSSERAPERTGAKVGGAPIDPTEPGLAPALGRRHIIMRVRDELCDVFGRMGFEVATGPELEDDEHNFIKLNIPPDHPARDPIDNFYIDDPAKTARPRMLRSQTSTVQVRVMETRRPPLKIVAPGRVYRPDTVDATHSFMFHQIEGLCVDRRITMADLKTTLFQFARVYFGPDAQVRLRPSYFPFTEPSAEFDMKIALRPGEPPRWIELGGCGMVDPAVFESVGVDPEEWTGFAFGFGVERIAMGKYGVPDIRMLYENDLRFLGQL